jgi:hypothetical protein
VRVGSGIASPTQTRPCALAASGCEGTSGRSSHTPCSKQSIVLSTNVSPGQLVSTMVRVTLLTMVTDSTWRVRAFIDEGEISKICMRQPVRVPSDAVPGMQRDGIVERHRCHRRKSICQ